ncbi:HipA N-terminal domain-containing protein [Verrucomicrobiota bacterium]
MSRKARVYNHGVLAGFLEEAAGGYMFRYDTNYLAMPDSKAICLTMPKQKEPYISEYMFPFFHGLLAEGVTKDIQCRSLKIDENDHLGRLMRTAHGDLIGSVTIEEAEEL